MATAQDILKIASAEVGYKEGKSNSNKYGKEYGLNNAPYCVIFLWCVFKWANASNLFYDGKKVASCTKLYEWAKRNGLIVEIPQTGDLVIFDWNKDKVTDHIGIIESTSGSTLYTIEGNTGDGNASDGDGVYRRTRSTASKFCYIRPKYSSISAENFSRYKWVQPTAYLPLIKYGAKGMYVITLQAILNGLGYDCGNVDGSYGSKTLMSVKAFQKANRLVIDGDVGKDTWSKLLTKR